MRLPALPPRRGLALAAALLASPTATTTLAQPAAAPAEAAATLPTLEVTGERAGSLTAPSVEAQRRTLERTPAAVRLVDGRDLANRYAFNLRDVLADTPGVFVQTRYGQELRLSVRGSGIARGFHLRGVEVLQDGIPVNLADGSGDFYQIDPLAIRSSPSTRAATGSPSALPPSAAPSTSSRPPRKRRRRPTSSAPRAAATAPGAFPARSRASSATGTGS